jgi:hypothetical protein
LQAGFFTDADFDRCPHPLFPIAFLVSLPIEPGIILGIMALGTLVAAIRMIMVAAKQNERA